MKRRLDPYFIFLILVCAFPAYPEEIQHNYYFAPPGLTVEGDRVRIEMAGCRLSLNAGRPMLPLFGATLLLPPETKLSRIAVKPGAETVIPGSFRVTAYPGSFPLSLPPSRTSKVPPDPTIYTSSSYYPSPLISSIRLQNKKGYRLLSFDLHPVRYFPAEGRLSYFQEISVTVYLEEEKGNSGKCFLFRKSETDRAGIEALVDNPQVLASYDGMEESDFKTSPLNTNDSYQHVIITDESLTSNFQSLCEHRTARWTSSTVVSTNWIYNHYPGTENGDNPDKIRDFIRDAYQNWDTQFVLLGGDHNLVPPRILYVEGVDNGALPPGRADWNPLSTFMPSDIYYSNLDGPFNYNENDKWGEQSDGVGGGDIDLWAEIAVGRFPVANEAETYYLTAKTIAYEDSASSYLNRASMVGERLDFGGIADFAKPYLEEVRLGSNSHYYTTTGFASNPWFDTSRTLYDQDWNPDRWPSSELAKLANSGVALINHLGHGNTYYAMKMTTSSLSQFTNTEPFMAYTQACKCGGFDNPDCWAEVLMTMEHGAFGLIANARYGFGARESTDGPSQHFAREFYDALLGEGIDYLGEMSVDSKEDNIPLIDQENIRWCYYQTNLFGDPAVRITRGSPSSAPFIQSGDYNGDGTSEIAIFRPSQGLWAVRDETRVYFGKNDDRPIPGDYNGDGSADISIFRPETGLWARRELSRFYFGRDSDTPLPDDYDGDGTCDPGIFRPSSGLWAIRDLTRTYLGGPGDVPLPGEYDGEGNLDIALFRPRNGLWAIQNISRFYFGGPLDVPVPGDYDGDGTEEASVFRPSSGLWAVKNLTRCYLGGKRTLAVPADYQGTAKKVMGIFQIDSGLWLIKEVTRIYFGAEGDLPVTK